MDYTIYVYRSGAGQGSISFQGESKPCWEDPARMIIAKTYVNCQAAYMAQKGRIAIAIPNEQTHRNGIYIHEGYSSTWSDGCIVTDPSLVKKMYDTLYANGAMFGATVIVSGSAGMAG